MKDTNAEKKGKIAEEINEPKNSAKPERLYAPGMRAGRTVGINAPDSIPDDVDLPAFNPPVPNRAWTAMRMGVDIDELSEEERRELYLGRDNYY